MNIQFYPDELDYVNAQLGTVANPNAEAPKCGGFLQAFLIACLRADHQNYEIILRVRQVPHFCPDCGTQLQREAA